VALEVLHFVHAIHLRIPCISHNKRGSSCIQHEQADLSDGDVCAVCETGTAHLYMT